MSLEESVWYIDVSRLNVKHRGLYEYFLKNREHDYWKTQLFECGMVLRIDHVLLYVEKINTASKNLVRKGSLFEGVMERRDRALTKVVERLINKFSAHHLLISYDRWGIDSEVNGGLSSDFWDRVFLEAKGKTE